MGQIPTINADRLLQRHAAMAVFGDTGRGGVMRPALGPEETEARQTLLDWARARNFTCSIDSIGNIFIRREGADPTLQPLRTGSHLDSQMPGGNFDGVYGVLASFEVLETLDDHDIATSRPVEVVVWTNEEGARFAPTTMGSAVHAGALALETAFASQDHDGCSVGESLFATLKQLGPLHAASLGSPAHAYVEVHIEQGPILEQSGFRIGLVTGIQGIAQFVVTVSGEEAHAGTTPRSRRKDAFMSALDLIAALRPMLEDAEDQVRFTIGSLQVRPGATNTVPSEVSFTIDLRHPDAEVLDGRCRTIADLCGAAALPCPIALRQTLNSPPVAFDTGVMATISSNADRLAIPHLALPSGATHDAKFMAGLCPTGMIFIPCRDGISHNEKEWAEPAHMIAGANLLLGVVMDLAGSA